MQRHRLPALRLQLQRHRLRHARAAADPRGRALSAINPYGQTKLMGETILRDLWRGRSAAGRWPAALLQPGGRARQRPDRRRPARHAEQPDALRGAGGRGALATPAQVFGNDYDTPRRHRRARLHPCDATWPRATWRRCGTCSTMRGSLTVNLGTGQGHSVLEVVRPMRRASGRERALRSRCRGGPATSPPAMPTRRCARAAAGLAGAS